MQIKVADFVSSYVFLDYIRGGCQLNLIAAIDFTQSNGNPNNPTSLHYQHTTEGNAYERALRAVGEILLNYDSDQKVPMYGFGLKYKGQPNHAFPLNFNPDDPEVCGIENMLTVYRQAVMNVDLFGPTVLKKIIRLTIDKATEAQINQVNQQYFILMIITDGKIDDLAETIKAVVAASYLPISIVIVGVGTDKFESMNRLSGNNGELVDNDQRKWLQDIVHFVPFNQFEGSSTLLTNEVLKEIPEQLERCFNFMGITPNPALTQMTINVNE